MAAETYGERVNAEPKGEKKPVATKDTVRKLGEIAIKNSGKK